MIVGFLSYAFFRYQPKVPERPVPSVEECKMGWDALLGIITTMIPILDAKRAREQEHVERVLNALGSKRPPNTPFVIKRAPTCAVAVR